MLKKNAIVKFVFLTILAILGILLCVCPFGVPYSSNHYNGFVNAINKGVDLDGGVSAIYNCTLPEGSDGNLSESIDKSLMKIKNIFAQENFSQLYVERQGGNKVYLLASSDAFEMNKAFSYIENGKELSFTTVQVSETLTNPDVYINSSDIKLVKGDYDYNAGTYGVKVEFTKEGGKKLETLKKTANSTSNKTVYVYLGELNSSNLFAEIPANSINIKENNLFLSASSNSSYKTSSAEEVREIAYSITGGMIDVELNLIEVSRISPVFGKNTQLYLGICILIIVALAFILLCVRYGELGLVGSLALVFYLILFTFFMQSIPFITLTLSGVIGSIISFLLASFAVAFIFEKMREEYKLGKKIHLSCKGGFKKSLWTILDLNAILVLASIFIWVLAPSSIKCFAITIILGSLLSIFISLALLRWFVNIYLAINSSKPKKMGLYRDKNIVEIKEENTEIVGEVDTKEDEISITENSSLENNIEENGESTTGDIVQNSDENLPNLEEVSND